MLCNTTAIAQYLHASGKNIVDKNGNNYILRGMGLGGWMLQEGYMLETNVGTQHEIRAKIAGVVGEANTVEFYDAWLANHCTKRDIDSLAAWGFNSVRLPMHYNLYTPPIEIDPNNTTWLEKGFALTDSLIKWCAANQMYVILDLHGAPGGQGNDYNISDRDPSKPSLWASDLNKAKTVALWKKLAQRYANEPWVGGYDLINETNFGFVTPNVNGCDETLNAPLRALFEQIIVAIRTVDQNHMIFIEGNCWANNHKGLLSPKLGNDNNLAISFHKYWSINDKGSIQGMLNIRDTYDVPLWLGESGENSNIWFTSAIRLMEENNIGWAWWPLKKVNSIVGPLTVVKTTGYAQLLNYWSGGGTKPTVAVAKASLMELAENLKIQNCIYHKDVIDAMFRQVGTKETIPFATNNVPGVVYASNYDMGRLNEAYYDTDTATLQVSIGGNFTSWNFGNSYRNDGVDNYTNADNQNSNGYSVGKIMNGEWLKYSVDVDSSAAYNVIVRYTSSTDATMIVNVNETNQTSLITLPSTGSNATWANHTIQNLVLLKGTQKLKVVFKTGGLNFGSLKFELSKKLSEIDFQATSASTANEGPEIFISTNTPIKSSSITSAGFTAAANGTAVTVSNVQSDPENPYLLIVTLGQQLNDGDEITVSYNGTGVTSTDDAPLQIFTDLEVINNLPVHVSIPGFLEAENFTVNQGLQSESTTDTGGGLNMGHTNIGDYLDFNVRVLESGEYTVEARVACNSKSGVIEIQQLSENGDLIVKKSLTVPVTGGWQTWTTVPIKMTLTQGVGILRIKIIETEFNMNWFKFTKIIVSGVDEGQGSLNIYPNPTDNNLFIDIPGQAYKRENFISIRNIAGQTIRHEEKLTKQSLNKIFVGDIADGLYIIELGLGKKVWQQKFIVKK